MSDVKILEPEEEPIHDWFELSYAQYLTIPRSVLQSMPVMWQERFVKYLRQLDAVMDWRPNSGRYMVTLKDNDGHKVDDPLMDYERGRRRLALNILPCEHCGEEAEITEIEHGVFKIKCTNQECKRPQYTSRDLAEILTAWNINDREDAGEVKP